MSPDLPVWEQQLCRYAALVLGIPFTWEHAVQGPYNSYPRGYFSGPTNLQEMGRSWLVYDDPTSPPKVENMMQMDVGIRVISQSQKSAHKAHGALIKFRQAMSLPHVRDAFNLMGLALANLPSINDMSAPGTMPNNPDSIVFMNLRFNARPQALYQDAGDDAGRLALIGLTSELLGLSNEIIP